MSAIHPMQTGNAFNTKGNNQNNGNKRVQKRKPNPLEDAREIDYLDAKFLTRFTNDQGKILPRRITGVNAYQQRQISQAIKHARHLALLSFVANDLN